MKIKYTLFGVFLAIGFSIAYAQEAIETPVEETIDQVPQVQVLTPPSVSRTRPATLSQEKQYEIEVQTLYQERVLQELRVMNNYLRKIYYEKS